MYPLFVGEFVSSRVTHTGEREKKKGEKSKSLVMYRVDVDVWIEVARRGVYRTLGPSRMHTLKVGL